MPYEWIAPCYRVSVQDLDGKDATYLMYYRGPSEKLREYLGSKQLVVRSIAHYDFKAWQERAAEATRKAVAGKEQCEPVTFEREIWSVLKHHLFESFHGKCAYCESRTTVVASGDVEHFRPKARVEEDDNHSGYYWLAYDVENLLPCCEQCNRVRGKMNRFPVEPGTRAYSPAEVPLEKPLLYNPRLDDPNDHLTYKANGIVAGCSTKGRTSAATYHLNREELLTARAEAIEAVLEKLLKLSAKKDDLALAYEALERLYFAGPYPYHTACLQRLVHLVDEVIRLKEAKRSGGGVGLMLRED